MRLFIAIRKFCRSIAGSARRLFLRFKERAREILAFVKPAVISTAKTVADIGIAAAKTVAAVATVVAANVWAWWNFKLIPEPQLVMIARLLAPSIVPAHKATILKLHPARDTLPEAFLA
jgi:hypothetical protein